MLTTVTHEEYMEAEIQRSAWVAVPGFHLQTCWHDLMHVLYLGCGRDIAASTVVSMWEWGQLPGRGVECLVSLNADYTAWCRALRLGRPRFLFTAASVGRTSKQQMPELSGFFKAMQVKCMLFFLTDKAACTRAGVQRGA